MNTTTGWREMKVGIFSKRDRGEPATPPEWASRTLPAPKGRLAFAAIEKSDNFGRRWKAWRKRLGLPDASAITVLADGARVRSCLGSKADLGRATPASLRSRGRAGCLSCLGAHR